MVGAPGVPRDYEAELDELRALTDTSLTRLEVDDLLVELLERVRQILEADTAAVLLLVEGSGELEARAARGIEEEVRQGVRIPLGVGFAGKIAATRGPIMLDRVDETTVANPILWEKGINVMLGVPLISGDDVIGVLHVGRLDERPFTRRDTELLQVVAERAASAIAARQLADEHAAAYLLERSLIPARLPKFPGLELAARYVTAERRAVGGDWYDVFTLPSGQCWIVVGDIAGHGLEAAVVMGRIRTALRAYTLLDVSPERVLELLDRKMSHFEMGTIATIAVVVLHPPFDSMQVALAGHLPPVLAVPESEPVLLDDERGPLLGAGFDGRRTSATLPLPPGATVVLYTDGLVERRDESLDAGLERLRHAVSTREPNRVAGEIMRRLIGNHVPDDDVAVVVVRRTREEADDTSG
jgi:sigma-B regulation protein RsbU (phosphoserine phosphatase)